MKSNENKRVKRLPAYPLVTVDPYFSIWSPTDKLYNSRTMNWTGIENQLAGYIKVDGVTKRFLGRERDFAIAQTSVECRPMTTVYTFEGMGIKLEASFFTPLFLDNPSLLSRPVSYIRFDVTPTDKKAHDVEIYFDMAAQVCRERDNQKISFSKGKLKDGTNFVSAGRIEQPVLEKSGDHLMIDWGRAYLCSDSECFEADSSLRQDFAENKELIGGEKKDWAIPVLATVISAKNLEKTHTSYITLAYDDVYSIEYFGEKLKAYCYKDGESFEDILNKGTAEKEELFKKCAEFDKNFLADYKISDSYKDILKASYRQAIAAHKAVCCNGELLFLSKECHSNGCIGTVDVTYPSIPLFLIYNPDFVNGMIRPIFKYAKSDAWNFEFAPHDVGTYPKANGQTYCENRREGQMPVEECGNMIITVYAAAYYGKDFSLAKENLDLLEKWADYLVENGYCPENQLCTDDFAGHLSKNANLSVKAIVGIACFGRLLNELGKDGSKYLKTAKEYAENWKKDLADGDHTMLTFDNPGSWSLKYNMVWDRIFDLGLFGSEVMNSEVKYYLSQQELCGIALDSRKPYTKVDWELWAAAMTDCEEDFEEVVGLVCNFLNETPDRVPFSDWYGIADGMHFDFQNRTVIGGLFIKLLTL